MTEPAFDQSLHREPSETVRRREIPFVVRGMVLKPDAVPLELTRAGSSLPVVPRFTEMMASNLLAADTLTDVPVQDIIGFIHRVGIQWSNEEYARRRLYIRQLQEIVGFSEEMAIAEADLIAAALRGMQRLYDSLDLELGSHRVVDEWVPRGECSVRAFPRGVFVHLLPGNVPVSAVVSMLRSLVTKNATILKFPSRDPVTCTSLALSFLDADPEHPVSRALSVVYWPKGDPRGTQLVRQADGVCVWGGGEALEWAQATAGPEAELVRFGPKQSCSVVELADGADPLSPARRVAHDVCMYDQNACFSTSRVFVAGDREQFVEKLAAELEHYDEILPPGRREADAEAHVSALRLHHHVLGNRIHLSDNWTIIECGPAEATTHPGRRTVFVHPVESVREVAEWMDDTVQTVAVFPWERQREIRDLVARRGVSRVVETGMSGILRLGTTHDGIDPAPRFVRMASVEAGRARHSKGMAIPIDTTEMVEDRQFRDLVV